MQNRDILLSACPPPPRKAASSLRVVHANLWHVLLLMIGLNAFSESYIIAQGCGPTGSVVYNCNCKNQWATNQVLNDCVCDGSYVDWGIDTENFNATDGTPADATDCLMLPNLRVSDYVETAYTDGGLTEGEGYIISPCDGLITSEHDNHPKIRVRSAIYNSGHGPFEIQGIVSSSDPGVYNTLQAVYAKKTDGTKKVYLRNTNLIAQLHPAHDHIHIENFLKVTLREDNGTEDILSWPIVGESTKISYCMQPTNTCNFVTSGGTVYNNYCSDIENMSTFENYNLGTTLSNCDWGGDNMAVMALNPGKVDVYVSGYVGQGISYAGVCSGTYHIVLQIDPDNNFVESNELDNITDMGSIEITDDLVPAEGVIAPAVGGGISWVAMNGVSFEIVYINNTIRVPSNKELIIRNSIVKFTDKGKIIVERGGTLTIENSLLTSVSATGCTDGTWQGIEVWGNPAISQIETAVYGWIIPGTWGITGYKSEDQDPGVVTIKGSTIENAQTAILTAKRNSDGSIDRNYAGGILVANEYIPPTTGTPIRNTFQNNSIDVYMEYRRSAGMVVPAIPNYNDYITGQVVSYIKKSDFIRHNKKNFGINLNFVKNIDITDCTFQGQTFGMLTKGKAISMIHSKTVMENNVLTGFAWGVRKFNAVNYIQKGINSIFRNNQLSKTDRGIYAYGGYADLFENNNFLQIPRPSIGINYDTYGIYTVSDKFFAARGNTFEGQTSTTTSLYNNFGLITDGGGLSSSSGGSLGGQVITENHFSNTDYGLSIQGNNQSLQIDCNLFGHNATPHRLSAWAIPDGLVAEQGILLCDDPIAPADNEWQYSPDDCMEVQDMRIGSTVFFIYNTHSPTDEARTVPNLATCVAEDNITIQECEQTKPDEACQLDGFKPPSPDDSPEKRLSDISELDTRIGNLQQAIVINEAQDELLAWIEDGGNPEYVATLIDNPLIPDVILVAALNQLNQLSKEAQLKVVQRNNPLSSQKLRDILLHRSPLPDEVLKAMTERIVPVATEVLQDLKEAQSVMPNMPNREVLRRQRQQLYAEREKARDLKTMLLLSLDDDATALALMQSCPSNDYPTQFSLAQYHLTQGNTAQARNTLNSMPNDDYATVLYIIADLADSNNPQPSSEQLNDLQILAQSPIAQAAMTARTLLCAANDSIYEHPIRKVEQGSGKTGYVPLESENNNYLRVVPNPANDFINIHTATDIPATLTIYDPSGKIIYTTGIAKKDQVIELNTTLWANGLYVYNLHNGGTSLQTGKIIITHNQ